MNFQEIFSIFVTICIALLSLFGNFLVIISLKQFAWLKTPTNYLVAVLAFYDLFHGLPVFVPSVVTSYIGSKYDNFTLNYEISCKFYAAAAAFSGFGNLLCIILITLDRYFYLFWPLRYHDLVTNCRSFIVSAICMMFAVIVSISAVYRSPVSKPCISIQMFNVYVVNYVLIPTFVLAFILVIALYGKIALLTYKARYSSVAPIETSNQSGSQKKTTKVISLVIGVFMMTYITFFAAVLVTKDRIDQLAVWVQTVAIWIWKVSK